MPKTDSYPFLILEFVPCTNFSLFRYKIANEHREFRNYLIRFLTFYFTLEGTFVNTPLQHEPLPFPAPVAERKADGAHEPVDGHGNPDAEDAHAEHGA